VYRVKIEPPEKKIEKPREVVVRRKNVTGLIAG